MQKSYFFGNVASDPEKRGQDGTVLAFRIACNRRTRNEQGEWEDTADFFPMVMFGNRAKAASPRACPSPSRRPRARTPGRPTTARTAPASSSSSRTSWSAARPSPPRRRRRICQHRERPNNGRSHHTSEHNKRRESAQTDADALLFFLSDYASCSTSSKKRVAP